MSWAARQFHFVLPLVLAGLAWPWAVAGLLGFVVKPRRVRIAIGLVAFGFAAWLVFFSGVSIWWKLAVVFLPILAMALILSSMRPKMDGDWVAEQAELPVARFDGDLVTIENFRHTVYRTLEDYDVNFVERTFDLSQLETVDFLVVPFAKWRGLAHVFVSFGFADGEHLAVSVEARREEDEPYSPVGGLFFRYEVIYVIGDERDVVAKRAVFQKHPVHLYPMITDHASARALLESMLHKANELAERPQFYHTVTNTCTSNVLVHATRLEDRPRRYDFRLVFPGFSDGLAVETGLIEAPDGLEALRERSLINGRAARASLEDGKAWSAAVRDHTDRPGPP